MRLKICKYLFLKYTFFQHNGKGGFISEPSSFYENISLHFGFCFTILDFALKIKIYAHTHTHPQPPHTCAFT